MSGPQLPPALLSQFVANRLRSGMAKLSALGDFQIVLAVRDEAGDVDYGVVDVRGGQAIAKGADAIDARAPYASLQVSAAQVAAMLGGGTVEPELAFETAPLLATIARVLSATGGVSPWQTRL